MHTTHTSTEKLLYLPLSGLFEFDYVRDFRINHLKRIIQLFTPLYKICHHKLISETKWECRQNQKNRRIDLPEREVSPYHKQLRWVKKTKRITKSMKRWTIRTRTLWIIQSNPSSWSISSVFWLAKTKRNTRETPSNWNQPIL